MLHRRIVLGGTESSASIAVTEKSVLEENELESFVGDEKHIKLVNSDSDSDESTGERTRRTNHATEIAQSFIPIRIFMILFGRVPFTSSVDKEGSVSYSWKYFSLPLIYFFFTALTTTVVLSFSCVGFVLLFFGYGTSNFRNRCDLTWENARLRAFTLPVTMNWAWLLLNFVGTYFIVSKGKEYLSYFKYWNRAVRVIDMNVTTRAKTFVIVTHLEEICLLLTFTILYIKNIHSVHEGVGAILNSVVRPFIQDIGRPDFSKFDSLGLQCFNKKGVHRNVFQPVVREDYTRLKLFYFIIQIFAFYGSHNFVVQFQYFSILLRNAAHTWNDRLRNMLHKVREKADDQAKRRLGLRLLMKDHLIISQLFSMTENTFAVVLQTFYFIHVVLMCCAMFSFIKLYNSDSCEAIYESFDADDTCQDVSNAIRKESVLFDDPCTDGSLEHAIVTIVILAILVIRFTRTTVLASVAYEEGAKGFDILRRHGYMLCKTRKERNFVHSLVVSFTRSNPIKISTGGFIINRTLIISVLGSVCSYFVIMLQFRNAEVRGFPTSCNVTLTANDSTTTTTAPTPTG